MRYYLLAVGIILAGCGSQNSGSISRTISNGPDPFTVVPNKALERPDSFTQLPTPGAAPSRAKINPMADATAALGGSVAGGVSGDRGLIGHVSRFGNDPAIRSALAAEYISDKRRSRLISRGRYYQYYRGSALDAYAEYERLKAAGVTVPSVPPR